MHTPPNGSIWGNINSCIEIGLEIYQLCCKDENGAEKKGIAIPAEKAKSLLSEKALAYGVEEDGFIYFENSDKLLAPLFELLKSTAITDKGYIDSIGGIKGVEAQGKKRLPEYFGEIPETPSDVPLSPEPPIQMEVTKLPLPEVGETINELLNGVSILNGEDVYVHKEYIRGNLSEAGLKLGKSNGDYIVFTGTLAAIPLFELAKTNEAVKNVIVSEESLRATLCEDYPEYIKNYNKSALPCAKINNADAPPNMFMQKHLDEAAENPDFYIGFEQDSGFEVLGDDELLHELER
ncbi:MAG: hypothetical protein LBC86_06600 [Oscillospiraceae bacterium]|nr:hypothetical protein [Oscillospiraceae bacterium]